MIVFFFDISWDKQHFFCGGWGGCIWDSWSVIFGMGMVGWTSMMWLVYNSDINGIYIYIRIYNGISTETVIYLYTYIIYILHLDNIFIILLIHINRIYYPMRNNINIHKLIWMVSQRDGSSKFSIRLTSPCFLASFLSLLGYWLSIAIVVRSNLWYLRI